MRRMFLFFSLFFCLLPITALAEDPKPVIRDESYEARFISQSEADPITLSAGETKTVTVRFKNVGTATWNAAGSRFVSAYTMEPRDRISFFWGDGWEGGKQTAPIMEKTKPGGIAEISISLHAPAKSGEYIEHFYLAAENHTWIKGGYFFLKIIVSPKPAEDRVESVSSHKAHRFLLNKSSVETVGGETVELIVGFQNIGESTWTTYAFAPKIKTSIAGVETQANLFVDDSWQDEGLILQKETIIPPTNILRETIRFRAPPKSGTYTASFVLLVNGEEVPGSALDIPVTVTENASNYVGTEDTGPTVSATRLAEEPRIRVGIWKPEDFVQFRSDEAAYDVYDGDTHVGVVPVGRLAVLKFVDGKYSFKSDDIEFLTGNPIRLVPVGNPHAVFILLNFRRQISWKGPRPFNMYRGALEYRLTQDEKTLYVINDLLFEDYVAGIAETSSIAPIEYIKALLTAARTYAYYVQQHTDKHDKRNFDVVAHTGDQLYLGYEHERLAPRVVEAAKATRGAMITYNNEIVITPYFGHSNGHTKSWVSVWGGSIKPWLMPVTADYDAGLKQYGHGVGMSQRDAALRADQEGMGWRDLVTYYYSGVDIEQMY